MKKQNDNTTKLWCLAIILVVGVVTLISSATKNAGTEGEREETHQAVVENTNVAEGNDNKEETSDASFSRQSSTTGNSKKSSSKIEDNSSTQDDAKYLPATHRGETIIRHKAYTLSFNTTYNNPNWVQWALTRNHAEGKGRRADEFLPDPQVEERHQVTTDDYKGSGYDRGHMCPAADNKWDVTAMKECFYMSNMCPQLHELNAGSWESLESACRRWAKQEGTIYIVSGPVYAWDAKTQVSGNRKQKHIGREHQVMVPTGFFKCVMSLRSGHEKAIGFYYSNDDKRQQMADVCMSVDEVEQMTGYDFFHDVDAKTESRIEATCSLKEWK